MATWNKPASNWGNMGRGNSPTSYSKSRVISLNNASWRDVPWDTLYKMCKDEQDLAAATAEAELKASYDRFIDKQLSLYSLHNPEAGAYEGTIHDEYPMGAVPNLFKIKRHASNLAIEEFISTYGIANIALTILPQIIAHIATFKLTTMSGNDYNAIEAAKSLKADTVEGLLSAASLYRAYFSDDTMLGLYNFLMADSRSKYLSTQYKAPARTYCSLVPLIMYAFKLTKGIPYSHWNRSQIQGITNVKLADAMLYTEAKQFSTEDILAARSTGLLVKSGPKLGQLRNPSYTHKLYGETPISNSPEYTQVMLAQIWCAHPENRTKYMVLDSDNWDNIPAPLIAGEVLQPIEFKHSSTPIDAPWA